ncbi:hypothetical protein HHK36_014572 [Tetracentron sinense]|uniref:Glycosyltransferase n=1 Tax=Tetracentron sinense TaxID=13715 RepID=A0A834Z3M9_TETSI|nr:hypothetical protein HHK36_014572 [Tetracentron sinense]
MASPTSVPHVVIFPFMAQGHTLPLVDLSRILARRGLKVTIITTPANASSILPQIVKHSNIHLTEIPFTPVDGLPEGCENTTHLPSMRLLATFIKATEGLQQGFELILRDMCQAEPESESRPICVISSFFLGWTLQTCLKFGIPRLVFHGMGVLTMAVFKSAWFEEPHRHVLLDSEPFEVPGLSLPFELTLEDLYESHRVPLRDDPLCQILSKLEEDDVNSWGVVANSFIEMDQDYVPRLNSLYRNGARTWCAGPFFMYDEMGVQNGDPNIEWLNQIPRHPNSVIYVSFGSQSNVSDTELDELACGLELSGHYFMWVVRSQTWSPPDGFEVRMKGRGVIVRDWVDQRRILAHSAIGVFLSHCGWNSILESFSFGVPLLAWPMAADQPLNAKFVEGLGAGMRMGVIGRERISEAVKELMGGGEKGSMAREKAQEWAIVAKQAVQEVEERNM